MAPPRTIKHRGKTYQVQDEITIRKRRYLVIRRLRGGAFPRLQVLDPGASVDGEMRVMHRLPRDKNTVHRVRLLSRVSERNHNVPTILEYTLQADHVDVVTKWIPGTPLATYLAQIDRGEMPPMSAYEAVRLFTRFVHGLCNLHFQKGVIHGDIKPDNLVLAPRNYELVLIDFGSAWSVERRAAFHEGDGRTPAYAAPEIIGGEPGHFLSDQFSATAVLFEMLTLDLPYDRLGGLADAANRDRATPIRLTPPSQLAPQRAKIPKRMWKQMDAVVKRGLELAPEARYPGPRDWLSDLDALVRLMRDPEELAPRNGKLLSAITRLRAWFGGATHEPRRD